MKNYVAICLLSLMDDNLGTFYGTHGRLCLEPGGRTI